MLLSNNITGVQTEEIVFVNRHPKQTSHRSGSRRGAKRQTSISKKAPLQTLLRPSGTNSFLRLKKMRCPTSHFSKKLCKKCLSQKPVAAPPCSKHYFKCDLGQISNQVINYVRLLIRPDLPKLPLVTPSNERSEQTRPYCSLLSLFERDLEQVYC